MNKRDAYKILELGEEDDISKIKKKYKELALKYHPDKNKSKDASNKFIEIKEAYELLSETQEDYKSYEVILKEYLNLIFKNDVVAEKINNILINIINKINTINILEYIKTIDKTTLLNLKELLLNNINLLHIDESLIVILEKIWRDKSNENNIVLNPSIDDLLNDNVYKLNYKDNSYIVPLWHYELYFKDNNNKYFNVYCKPKLDDNIIIDINNNIYIDIEKNILEIFNKGELEINIGEKKIKISNNKIRLIKYQEIILTNNGIPRMNSLNILDNKKRANIIIRLTLEI